MVVRPVPASTADEALHSGDFAESIFRRDQDWRKSSAAAAVLGAPRM